MTAIAVKRTSTEVIMSCDQLGSNGHGRTVVKTPKIFQVDGWLVGYTSSFRMGDLLRYTFTFPLAKPDLDEDVYMRTLFVTALRECLKAGGYAKTENGEESGGCFLVASKTNIYEVQADFSVLTVAREYHAVGSGAEVCLGAMFAGATPAEAIAAAESHIVTVGNGVSTLTIPLT